MTGCSFPEKSTTWNVTSADRAAHQAARPGTESEPARSPTYHMITRSALSPTIRQAGVTSDLTALCHHQDFRSKKWRATKQPSQMFLPLYARHLGAWTHPKGKRSPPLGHAGPGESAEVSSVGWQWMLWAVLSPNAGSQLLACPGGPPQIDHCLDAPQSETAKDSWDLLARRQAELGTRAGTALWDAGGYRSRF